jgi:hypothetical protein
MLMNEGTYLDHSIRANLLRDLESMDFWRFKTGSGAPMHCCERIAAAPREPICIPKEGCTSLSAAVGENLSPAPSRRVPARHKLLT